MALTFKDLIKATKEYAEAESRTKVVESISSEDFKRLMKEAVLMGGDVNENIMKLYDEMRAQTAILEKSQKEDQISVEKDKESVSVAKDQTNLLNDLIDTSQSIDSNVVKLQDEIRSQTKAIESGRKDATAIAEDKQEAEKADKEKTDTLKKIADNTDPSKQKKVSEDLGLGAIVTGITVALAGLAGAVAGYVKSIKVFLDVLTPQFIKDKVFKTFSNIEKTFAEFAKKIRTVVAYAEFAIAEVFDSIKTKFSKLFVMDEGSKLSKFISSFNESFAKIIAPFKEAFTTIKSLFSGTAEGLKFVGDAASKITKVVASIGETLSGAVKLFKGVFTVVSKLATPLFMIMTVWDTIKGAIEGFDKAGILGAVIGGIKGLVSSIITVPLDLIKDIVSWTLDALGLDFLSEILDSFSFDTIWSDLMDGLMSVADALMHPIDTLMSVFDKVSEAIDEYIMQPLADAFKPITDFFVGIKDSIVGFFEAIEIPKIGFTIPIIDKEVSIGPFYPFKREKPTEATVTGGETAAPTKTTTKTATPQKGSREEYDAVYKQNLEKTGGNERVAQKLTARDVNLAPGAHPDTLPRTAPVVGAVTPVTPVQTTTATTATPVTPVTTATPVTPVQTTTATPVTPGQVILASKESPEIKEDFDTEGARISYQPIYDKYVKTGLAPAEAKVAADRETGLSPDVTSNFISTTNNVATVKSSGISQDLVIPSTTIPGGAVIPPAIGKETREQTTERITNALKAGVEEKKAEVRALERGEKVAPEKIQPVFSNLEMNDNLSKIQSSTDTTNVANTTNAAKVIDLSKIQSSTTINGDTVASSRQQYYEQQGFTPEQIKTLNERQSKIDALRSQDPNINIDKDLAIVESQTLSLSKQAEENRKVTSEQVTKEANSYSSKFDIQGVLATPQQKVMAVPAGDSGAANMIYGASAENAEVSSIRSSGESTSNTIVAPTNVTNNTVNSYKPDVRNQESSFKRMLDARYVPV